MTLFGVHVSERLTNKRHRDGGAEHWLGQKEQERVVPSGRQRCQHDSPDSIANKVIHHRREMRINWSPVSAT